MALGRQMVMVGQGSPHAAPAPQAPSLTGGSGAVGGGTGDGREARERLVAKEEKGASSESGWLPTISHGKSPLSRDRHRSWP